MNITKPTHNETTKMATPSHPTWFGSPRSSHYPPHKEAPPGVYTRYIHQENKKQQYISIIIHEKQKQ